MFNNNSNKTLWIVFAILLVAVILIFTTESTKKERSFKKDLVSLDTSAITSISIFPKSKPGQEVKLLKNDGIWKVFAENGKSYNVPNFKMNSFFGELSRIKPKRVAARSKSKWAEYEVDSSATRVVLNESGNEVLNLVIGKFAFQQPRSMSTFVRLMNDKDVYEVDGFLEMTFNKDANSLRNETIIKYDTKKWSRVIFDYPADSSFSITRIDEKWLLNGSLAIDSSKAEQFMNKLSKVSSAEYVDNFDSSILNNIYSKLTIETVSGEKIVITSFKNNSTYLINSSLNSENYFDGNKVGSKIFLSKKSLIDN